MQKECEKYEEWGIGFVSLITLLVLLTLALGLYFSYVSGIIPVLGFIALTIANIYGAFYATCRHCYYYGKRCYIALGLVVPYFFRRVEVPSTDLKMGLWMGIFVLNILYPLPFIYAQNHLLQFLTYSVAYLVPPIIALVLVTRSSCPHCKNVTCLSNPDRKKRSAIQGISA